jgi:uncharacterized Zn-binding protein involved in type VI secretion
MARSAARIDDNHIYPLVAPAIHAGGPILLPGAPLTFINGKNAARVSDKAFCTAPAPDTLRGGLITVFIDGNPASRIADKTDVGSIVAGSADVLLGEWGGGPLTSFQAKWLYDYLAKQGDIPFEYATDGCFARADRMSDLISSLGIPVQKQWVSATAASGLLQVPINNYPGNGVKWLWHVAPTVQVAQPGGGSLPMIMDPSLRPGAPITVEHWIGVQSSNPTATATTVTSPRVYKNPYNESTKAWRPRDGSPSETARDLELYRIRREGLPASSGRNVPIAPVHF